MLIQTTTAILDIDNNFGIQYFNYLTDTVSDYDE